LILYAEILSPRLHYVTGFINREIPGAKITVTGNREEYLSSGIPKINYSSTRLAEEEVWIKPHGLLSEHTIRHQDIRCSEYNGQKIFFETGGDLPFDILAACFYLLTRYEEYLPHRKDMYGRYAHENALAFREGFLQVPLINVWLQDFKERVREKFPVFTPEEKSFTFLPTYDIDIAFSYKGKGFAKNAAGMIRSLLRGDLSAVTERFKVLSGRVQDPYDSFEWMDALHDEFGLHPVYFFLVPEKRGKYDKNISPSKPVLQRLIKNSSVKYPTAIHPSWQSGDEHRLLREEIKTLERLTAKKTDTSRFHYVRFSLPEDYRRLIREGITKDHSMGYGSINGFRASVASAFFWYDLEREEQTGLAVYPFCFMEANSYYEQKLSVQETMDEIRHYHQVVRSVNGLLITLWHNHFFGTAGEFRGLKEVYRGFIEEVFST